VRTLRTQGWQPYGLATWVEWCGHQQEVVLSARGGRVVHGDPGARGGDVMSLRTLKSCYAAT